MPLWFPVFLRFLWGILVFPPPASPLHIPDNPQAHWIGISSCFPFFPHNTPHTFQKNFTNALLPSYGHGETVPPLFSQNLFKSMAAPSSNRLPTTVELFCYPPPPRMGFIGEKGDQKACKHEELRAQLGTHFGLRCNKWSLQGPNKSGPNFANPSQIAHTIWFDLDFARKVTSTELCKFWCEKIAFSDILRTSQIKPWATSPISSTPSRIGVNPGLSCRPLILYFFPQVELTWHGKMGLTSKKT